jgi:hypothetical protein
MYGATGPCFPLPDHTGIVFWINTQLASYFVMHLSHACVHAGALTNGTIQVWTTTGNFGKSAALDVVNVPQAQMPLFGKQTWKYAGSAKHIAKNAHPPNTEVSDIRMLQDAVSCLTRAADDTLKLWDIRLLKQAVHVWDVPAAHTHTRMCVSPKEDLVLTGAVPISLLLLSRSSPRDPRYSIL